LAGRLKGDNKDEFEGATERSAVFFAKSYVTVEIFGIANECSKIWHKKIQQLGKFTHT